MRFWRKRRLRNAARSAYQQLEPYSYHPEDDVRRDAETADRAMRLGSIRDDLVGRSAGDVVQSGRKRVDVIRELVSIADGLPLGAEQQDLLMAAGDLYDADPSVAWVVLNSQLRATLDIKPVANWLAEHVAPESTDPRSADQSEVREFLAETFADVTITDLSADQRRALVLGQLDVDRARANRWIDRFLDDPWRGEPRPVLPEDVRTALGDELLSR